MELSQENFHTKDADCCFLRFDDHDTSVISKWMSRSVRSKTTNIETNTCSQLLEPQTLGSGGECPSQLFFFFFLALLAHCPAYSYHIMVHLHNPACDWSQFNGGWQSISITMFLLSVRQQKHNSDEILWRTDLFSNHKEEK